MNGAKHSLNFIQKRAYRVFNREPKQNRHTCKILRKQAFPAVSWSVNRHINVKGNKSPYDGDLVYWSKRNSTLYTGLTAKTLVEQHHTCAACGHKLLDDESVHLHHRDGNHANWKPNNLQALHESCHDYLHGQGISLECREPDAVKVARPDLTGRGGVSSLPSTQTVSIVRSRGN